MQRTLCTGLFVLLVFLASLGNARAETIDFEGLPAGTIVSTVSGDGGSGPITVQGKNPRFSAGTNAAVIFDSANPTGGDTDLGTPNQDFGGPGVGAGGETGSPFQNDTALGNVLIVAEDLVDGNGDGLVDDPDDVDNVGSMITLDFSALGSVTIFEITIIDVEAVEPAATVELFDGGGGSLGMFTLPQVGNNGVDTVSLGATSDVVTMVVTLNGSAAIDNIVFQGPVCGDGNVDEGEQCDDGNTVGGDGCSATCTLEACGNGILDPGEQCDDGNLIDGDGCSAICQLEPVVCALDVIKTATPDTIIPGPEPICDKKNKPTSLTFKYTGGGCGASDNTQKADKVDCQGIVDSGEAVTVTAAGGKDASKLYSVDPTMVDPGGEFTIFASKFEADSTAELTNGGGTEVNKFHTSCSQPLKVGDVFGSLTLVAIDGQGAASNLVTYDYQVTNNGDSATVTLIDNLFGTIAENVSVGEGQTASFTRTQEIVQTTTNIVTVTGIVATGDTCQATDTATVTVEEPLLSCADGDPKLLVMEYTGEDCNASSNTQDPKKVKCKGAAGLSQVRILANDKEKPFDPKAKVWFDGQVTLDTDTTFSIVAANAGVNKLKANTVVHIFNQGGEVVQTVTFHTSCSQPLNVGDQFGSLILRTFVPE